MTQPQQIIGLQVSFDTYIRHGWHLVPIAPNSKGPKVKDWNKKENCLRDSSAVPPGWGVGLAHAYSGTCAIDVDDWDKAEFDLMLQGISLQTLFDAPDAVTINSGRAGHGKLLYRMPFGLVLPSKKLIIKQSDGKHTNYLDFRCGTNDNLTMQDVLPPTIHPETRQPYYWGGKGRWESLPIIPDALLNYWQDLLSKDAERTIKVERNHDTSWDEIRSALSSINPDISREEWVRIGMALHAVDQSEMGFSVWDEWSSNGEKYKGQNDLMASWRGFKPEHGITIASLFRLAYDAGWSRPAPDIAGMFDSVTPAEPSTIKKMFRVPAPEPDFSLIPPLLARRSNEVADSIGCDPLVPLWAGLGAVCAAADAQTRLELMPGFKVPPILWMMTIGNPADKKSPGARPMMSILKQLELEDRPRYASETLRFEGEDSMYAASKKAYLAAAADPVHMLGGALDFQALPQVMAQPKPPVPLRLTVSDITSQKLVRMCADRPEGLLAHLDEMRGWCSRLMSSSSGDNIDSWTKGYEADSESMDRVGDGKASADVVADNFAVSIMGNIQPRVFREVLRPLSHNGLLQRFMPAILRDELGDRLGNPIPDFMTCQAEYELMVRQVRAAGKMTYTLSSEARAAYRQFQEWFIARKKDEKLVKTDDIFMTALGKLEGTCGRLILIWHMIESPLMTEVSGDTAKRAIAFCQSYVVNACRYAYGEIGGINTDNLTLWLADHIIHVGGETDRVSLSELKRAGKRRIEDAPVHHQDQIIRDAMIDLEHHGWVAMVEHNLKTTVWAINPEITTLYADHRRAVMEAKQRIYDQIHERSGGKAPRRIVKGYEDAA